MKRVLFYCQHVLGMGHYMRSLALIEGLAEEFEVEFLNGGETVPGVDIPAGVTVTQLPPLSMDAGFNRLEGGPGVDPAAVQSLRRDLVFATYQRVRPNAVVIELFPFGRRRFASELVPLLAHIRKHDPAVTVICSVRDILVNKAEQARHDARAIRQLNRYFDLVLVHSDPTFQRLEETFSPAAPIAPPVEHTGFVAQALPQAGDNPAEPVADRPLLVASIGGGRVGCELLDAAIAASILLARDLAHRLVVCAGPYLPEDDFARLGALAQGHEHIVLRRFVTRFVELLARADLSLSMAGYNTSMNVVAAGTRSLMLPFRGNGNDEQSIRVTKLAELGVTGVLGRDELDGPTLSGRIKAQLRAEPTQVSLDLGGVERSVKLVKEAVGARPKSTIQTQQVPAELLEFMSRLDASFRDTTDQLDLFLRDDDVADENDSLLELLDVGISRGVPINFEIIPGRLTAAATDLLRDAYRSHPDLVELNQHGWRHVNHETVGKKQEFGPSRSFEQQLLDISTGKRVLEEAFEERFAPVFTPPWNRCTVDTYRVLDELGFTVLSKDLSNGPVAGYGFVDLSTSTDIFTWKGGAALRPPGHIFENLMQQATARRPVGLLLHHEVMDGKAFDLLDQLLAALTRRPYVRFHTFASLLRTAHQASFAS